MVVILGVCVDTICPPGCSRRRYRIRAGELALPFLRSRLLLALPHHGHVVDVEGQAAELHVNRNAYDVALQQHASESKVGGAARRSVTHVTRRLLA